MLGIPKGTIVEAFVNFNKKLTTLSYKGMNSSTRNKLRPKEISEEDLCEYLCSSNNGIKEKQLKSIWAIKDNLAVYHCSAMLLTTMKNFDQTINEKMTRFVDSPEDLNYTAESCGKQQYEEYRKALKNATGLISTFKRNHDLGERSEFISEFVENQKIKSLYQFFNEMTSEMDRALSWICYLFNDQNMKLDSILFQEKNPLVPIFSGIRSRLRTPEPFNHVYEVSSANEFQKCLLDSTNNNVFINYPKLIIFCGKDNQVIHGELPKTVTLPLKLDKQALSHVVERIISWKSVNLSESKEVIQKYENTFKLIHYELAGSVCGTDDKYYVVSANDGEASLSQTKSTDKNTVCVMYQIIE